MATLEPAVNETYLRQTFGLAGRTALVTGGYGGLGLAIAAALGRAGARVVVNGRSAVRCDEAVRTLGEQGICAVAAPFDVADEAAVAGAVARLQAEGMAVDTLAVTAGVQQRNPIVDMTLAQWQALMNVHVNGSFNCVRACLPGMLERGYGRIVLMSSVAASEAMPNIAAYASAKGAISAFTRAVAVEYGARGVTANALAPGFVRTSLTSALQDNPDFQQFIATAVPQGRWAEPADIAPAVVFLASPAAGFINGHVLTIDGGMLARM